MEVIALEVDSTALAAAVAAVAAGSISVADESVAAVAAELLAEFAYHIAEVVEYIAEVVEYIAEFVEHIAEVVETVGALEGAADLESSQVHKQNPEEIEKSSLQSVARQNLRQQSAGSLAAFSSCSNTALHLQWRRLLQELKNKLQHLTRF